MPQLQLHWRYVMQKRKTQRTSQQHPLLFSVDGLQLAIAAVGFSVDQLVCGPLVETPQMDDF